MKRRRLISSLSEAGSVFFFFFSSESTGALFPGFDVCCLAVADAVQDFTPSCDHKTMHMLTETGSISDNSLQRCISFFFFTAAGGVSAKYGKQRAPPCTGREEAKAGSQPLILSISRMLLLNWKGDKCISPPFSFSCNVFSWE